MRKTLVALVATSALFLVPSHGAVVFTTLDNNNNGSFSAITSTPSAGRGLAFTIPSVSSYILTSVEMDLIYVADAPVENPEVAIWSYDSVSPTTPFGTFLATLTPAGPLVEGMNTFTSSGIILDAGQTYWVVTRNTGDWFGWKSSASAPTIGSSPARLHALFGDPDPRTWGNTLITTGSYNAARINADAIPEPTSALLSSVALLGLLKRHRA